MQDERGQKHIGWSQERVTLLQKLWLIDGLSASLCARRLGGTTRHAVIGKLHRLGISRRGGTLHSLRPAPREREMTRPSLVSRNRSILEYLPPIRASNDKARKSLADLDDSDCRYIVGEASGTKPCFCALPKFPGFPYCSDHVSRTHELPAKIRNRNNAPDAKSDASAPLIKEDA